LAGILSEDEMRCQTFDRIFIDLEQANGPSIFHLLINLMACPTRIDI
jgi:predicted O-methyltransferase YrrM